jgi:hypothetical protein
MIIRWCLYIRSKSAVAYDSLRNTGFIKLPSARTLFDYSHFTKSALGFQPDVVKLLYEEAEKLGMLGDESYKCHVGLLFDEIKVKEDLVYDKHTGELIGYCNLDDVGNQILELEKNITKSSSKHASCMLVLMVRGVATSLRFPFAGFATNSITADFLYPILWKAVSILEVTVKLKVLFFTCDGASANRKFFQMHRPEGQNQAVYFTPNPHDEARKIYFISDVPHLLKTTRNCYSNSNSHKMTRRLWKDGKDISWMHVVRLFEEHCEQSLYTPCPKLTRAHIDLTPFSCMKVNLAAQILSGTVANALEEYYGEEVSETVQFIRIFNKFFDCLNVRNILEGRNKRNPHLDPYRNVDDPRITWLREDFLGYLRDWEAAVDNRIGNLNSAQKAAMQLSHQTKTGLQLTVKSITECIEFMLGEGAEFVLTRNFNQDPLEQYFGHFRHKGGANNNPSVFDVRNTMAQLHAYRTQALAPKRGNITCENEENQELIDNTKLAKRKR